MLHLIREMVLNRIVQTDK